MSTTTFDRAWNPPCPNNDALRRVKRTALVAAVACGGLALSSTMSMSAGESLATGAATTSSATSLTPQNFTASSGLSGLLSLPLQFQFKMNGVLGVDDPQYLIQNGTGGPQAFTSTYDFTTDFTKSGPVASNDVGSLGLTLTGVGYGATMAAPAPAVVTSHNNQVRYARGNITETYVNGPLGVAQTFKIAAPPSGTRNGSLTLTMNVGGGLVPSISKDGDSAAFVDRGTPVFHYRGLTVTDAKDKAIPAHLSAHRNSLQIVVDDRFATYPLNVDPMIHDETFKPGEDGSGWSTSIGARSIAVGSPKANNNSGKAYFFPQVTSVSPMHTLQIADPEAVPQAQYGYAVATNDTHLLVGVPGYSALAYRDGAAVLYKCTNFCVSSAPAYEAVQYAHDGSANDNMGTSVALSKGSTPNNVVSVVGAPGDDWGSRTDAGSVRVYRSEGAPSVGYSWAAALVSDDPRPGDRFGTSVGISDTNQDIVVGAPGDDDYAGADQGSMMIFDYNWPQPGSVGVSYTPTRKLFGYLTGVSAGANFGTSVAISADGKTAVAGASRMDAAGTDAGGAVVFNKGANWTDGFPGYRLLLHQSGTVAGDMAGSSVAVSANGTTVLVGAPRAEDPSGNGTFTNEGRVYRYQLPTSGWDVVTTAAQAIHSAEGENHEDHFGDTLDVSDDGNRATIGTPFNTDSLGNRGHVELHVNS